MQYIDFYKSPIGDMMMACDEVGLSGLWFEGKKYFASTLNPNEPRVQKALPIFEQTKKWLDIYFEGKNPAFMPALSLKGSEFRLAVWEILNQIPYGEVITYGDIAKQIAGQRGVEKMSAQAVGGAVGHNPIAIIVPCHRVVGTNGSLTGYGGGIDKKIELLKLEGIDISQYSLPREKKKNSPKACNDMI